MERANVTATERVLDAATETGVARIVHVSTINAFGNTGYRVVDETFERPRPYHVLGNGRKGAARAQLRATRPRVGARRDLRVLGGGGPHPAVLRAALALIASWRYCASPGAIFS